MKQSSGAWLGVGDCLLNIMRSTFAALCISWILALTLAHPLSHGGRSSSTGKWHHLGSYPLLNSSELIRRCADEEGFDAVTLDETGTMLFFKGDLVWKGFTASAEPINVTWPSIQGPIDAALRIHRRDHPDIHDSVYLFQGKMVWAYTKGKLRDGFPRLIGAEFKGVPADLDAAVECHPGECAAETVLFFKGPQVLAYDLETGILKRRMWPAVSNCTAAVRWLERYYCFQGIRFLRFDPVTGAVPPRYPRDARDYFMRCPGRGHGNETRGNTTLRAITDLCSGYPFQAFFSDDSGRTYAFRGGQYFRLDSVRDGWHAWPLSHTWKEMEGEVDAAFSWEDKVYLIQRSQVTVYRSGHGYSRVEGYPRALQEELGISGADATFTCPHSPILYVIQGDQMKQVDLRRSPRQPEAPEHIPHPHVDSALCTAQGVSLFHGANVYQYSDVSRLRAALVPASSHNAAVTLFRCPMPGSPQAPQHFSH